MKLHMILIKLHSINHFQVIKQYIYLLVNLFTNWCILISLKQKKIRFVEYPTVRRLSLTSRIIFFHNSLLLLYSCTTPNSYNILFVSSLVFLGFLLFVFHLDLNSIAFLGSLWSSILFTCLNCIRKVRSEVALKRKSITKVFLAFFKYKIVDYKRKFSEVEINALRRSCKISKLYQFFINIIKEKCLIACL